MRLRWGIVLCCVLVAACDGGSSPGDDDDDDVREIVVDVPVTPNLDVDILFMIDDSPSMADKQANLAANFPNFINKLASNPGGLPNLHLGVISSDMGTSGSGSATPAPGIGQIGQGGCAARGKAGALTVNGAPLDAGSKFAIDVATPGGGRQTNFTGNLAEVFGQMARLGAGGCGFEQPLAAIKAALDNNPSNAGFLRPDALLAIVLLTDEDDCSAKDAGLFASDEITLGPLQSFRCTRFGVTCGGGGGSPDAMNQVGVKTDCEASTSSDLLDGVEGFHDFLVSLKADPKKVVATAITGTVDPFQVELRPAPGGGTAQTALAHSCTFQGANGTEVADPPVRIQSFLDLFPSRSATSSICQSDLSGGLGLIGDLITESIGSPCLSRDVTDIDDDAPGLQVDCLVEDVVGVNSTQIAPCDSSETPTCWKLDEDPEACPSRQNLKLTVVRSEAPDPATVTRMSCVVR
ncbi:MAG: hypothetical protein ABI867_19675 [Kofleriaceae bacterium]